MDAATSGFSLIIAFVVGIFVICLSIAWLIFPFLMMSRLKLIREELAKGNETSAAMLRAMQGLAPARSLPAARELPAVGAQRAAPPVGAIARRINVSRNGQELGTMDIQTVKTMVEEGSLSRKEDFYFDPEFNQWVALECHPEFC
jgi:hypothetical protein